MNFVDLVEVAGARSPSLKRIGDKQSEAMEERATEVVTSAGDVPPLSLASGVQWSGRWKNPSHLEWMRASNQNVAGEGSSGFVEKMDATYDNERVAPAPPKRSWLRLGDEQPTFVSVRAAGITQNSLLGVAGHLAVLFYPTSPTGSPITPAPSILAIHDLCTRSSLGPLDAKCWIILVSGTGRNRDGGGQWKKHLSLPCVGSLQWISAASLQTEHLSGNVLAGAQ